MTDYGVEVAERDGWAVVAISGQVDLATAPALKERMLALVTDGHDHLICDLTSTEFLDSTALGALVSVLKRLRVKGGKMRLVCTSPSILKVFDITGLDRVFPIHASLEEATAAG
ncbi:MAG TPA: STAS domain-containing protein [Acidimicrobiales bacterium]|nr:STAS domain-containing protein [Acidimicrobiales bacterium]